MPMIGLSHLLYKSGTKYVPTLRPVGRLNKLDSAWPQSVLCFQHHLCLPREKVRLVVQWLVQAPSQFIS